MSIVFVPKERAAGETRVAATPETVRRLVREGFKVQVESEAGGGAHISDDRFAEAGADIVDVAAVRRAWETADVVLKVGAPGANPALPASEAQSIRQGALLIAMMAAHQNAPLVQSLRDRGVSSLAMELVPRISRAQSMDALSSQASIAGYKAVLLAATHLDKYFPLLMTAAGTVQPARVVVMGAGVAGLQALATAKRLGASVEVSDIRPAVKEQVLSLGGKFIDLPMQESGEGVGGYAKEVSADFLRRQQEIIHAHISAADVVITTALVPGKPAPKLVSVDMVKAMRQGAVIVDLAVEQGGNCELSERDQTVTRHGVIILGPSNLPASMPGDASHLYARNLLALLLHVSQKGQVVLDTSDEIVRGALLTHQGQVTHEPTLKSLAA